MKTKGVAIVITELPGCGARGSGRHTIRLQRLAGATKHDTRLQSLSKLLQDAKLFEQL